MRDSNSQHAVLETAALPIELIPYNLALFYSGLTGEVTLRPPPLAEVQVLAEPSPIFKFVERQLRP